MLRLIINQDVFIWEHKESGVAYHSGMRTGFQFEVKGQCKPLVQDLLDPASLYSIVLDNSDYLNDPYAANFINLLVEHGFAQLIDDDGSIPLSLKPILKIQDDKIYYKWLNKQGIDGAVINNLHSIHINCGDAGGDDLVASQTIYPIKTTEFKIDDETLKNFIISSCSSSFLSEVVIIGNPRGKIGEKVLDEISQFVNLKICLYDHDVFNCELKSIACKHGEIISVIRLKRFSEKDIHLLKESLSSFDEVFLLLESHEDIINAENLLDPHLMSKTNLIPVYDGDNMDFIKSILEISCDELLLSGPGKRTIFTQMTMNTFNFGNLYVYPNGCIRPSTVGEFIGDVHENLKDLVYGELMDGQSWFKIRDFEPCTNCVFRWLCPSPSSYEKLLGGPICSRCRE